MSPFRATALCCLNAIAILPCAAQAADVEAGRKAAERHCSRCHVVGDYNPTGGISSTPSFQLMVNALKDYQERFATFYERQPHPAAVTIEGIERANKLPFNAAPITLTLDDVENIAAFAETLKKPD